MSEDIIGSGLEPIKRLSDFAEQFTSTDNQHQQRMLEEVNETLTKLEDLLRYAKQIQKLVRQWRLTSREPDLAQLAVAEEGLRRVFAQLNPNASG